MTVHAVYLNAGAIHYLARCLFWRNSSSFSNVSSAWQSVSAFRQNNWSSTEKSFDWCTGWQNCVVFYEYCLYFWKSPCLKLRSESLRYARHWLFADTLELECGRTKNLSWSSSVDSDWSESDSPSVATGTGLQTVSSICVYRALSAESSTQYNLNFGWRTAA